MVTGVRDMNTFDKALLNSEINEVVWSALNNGNLSDTRHFQHSSEFFRMSESEAATSGIHQTFPWKVINIVRITITWRVNT